MASLTFTARWLFPVDGPPLPRGTLSIAGERITAVEPAGRRPADIDLGNVALVPGFVNAHTHLDLCDAAGKLPLTHDFTAWLRQVIHHRRQQTQEQLEPAIREGVEQSLQFGVVALGDISAQGASWEHLSRSPLDAVIYREAIGLKNESADASFERVREWCETRPASARCRPGISPHAPYTVGRRLLERLVALQTANQKAGVLLPFAIHLGETRDELSLLAKREGAFIAFLKDLGVYDAAALLPGAEPWLSCSSIPSTFVHGNYLDPQAVAKGSVRALVYCPRTHAAFGHEPYPLDEFLAAGVTVALGTDSLASNPDLNLLAEARFVHERFPHIPGNAILQMATLNGATALGDEFAARLGTLTPGKDATFAAIPLPNEDASDPHSLLWQATANPVRTMIRGKWREPGGTVAPSR